MTIPHSGTGLEGESPKDALPENARPGNGWCRIPLPRSARHGRRRIRVPAMDVRIEQLNPIRVARMRHVGPYTDVGPCFQRLFRWASAIGVPTGRVLTLSWDDPETVATERLRCDACVELRTDQEPPPGIVLGPVGGGRHAVHRFVGPYQGIAKAYSRLCNEWLPGSGESLAEGPRMEIYRKTRADTRPDRRVTDLCVPLRDRMHR